MTSEPYIKLTNGPHITNDYCYIHNLLFKILLYPARYKAHFRPSTMCPFQVSAAFSGLREASEAAARARAAAEARFLAVSTGQESPSESLQDLLMGSYATVSLAAYF